jgi:two-component system, LytTR family, response regulator
MITCLAIDDEPLALEVIRRYTADTPRVKLLETFTDAIQAISFLKVHPVDLLILDIQMPDITGIQLMQGLKEPPLVIFTTAYPQYAVKGFELEAVDYLVKPFRFDRFLMAIDRVEKRLKTEKAPPEEAQDGFLFVKSGYGTVRINFADVLYIEGLDDYVKIHFTDQRRPVLSLMSLKSMLEKLPDGQFMRVHRSFIVSLPHIRSIRKKFISLGMAAVPVGDTYNEAVQMWLAGR